MPKKGRKKGSEPRGGGGGRRALDGGVEGTDEEGGEGSIDTMSMSCASEMHHTDGSEETELDESSTQDIMEDKLLELIEGTNQKSAKGRVDSLVALRALMSGKMMPDFLATRKAGVAATLARCLLKGKADEQSAAAGCCVLLVLQLGGGGGGGGAEGGEVEEVAAALRTVVVDGSAALTARAVCAEALALVTFLTDNEITLEVLACLETVFRPSCPPRGAGSGAGGGGGGHLLAPEVTALHSSALAGWALLLTVTQQPQTTTDSHLSKLHGVLLSSDVELRIAAGEAIALLYELARDNDEDFEAACHDELCVTLKCLATECNKFRAKRDRRQQRSSFRDVLGSVEGEGWHPETIKLCRSQQLSLNSWVVRTQYDALCHILGSGMNLHLQENELLREIFALGRPRSSAELNGARASKEDRQFQHDAAFKQRSKSRNKLRDRKTQCGTSFD